jgi:hypothetical protein
MKTILLNTLSSDIEIPLTTGGALQVGANSPVDVTDTLSSIDPQNLEDLQISGAIRLFKDFLLCSSCSDIVPESSWHLSILDIPPAPFCTHCTLSKLLWAIALSHRIMIDTVTKSIAITRSTPLEWMQFHGERLDVVAFETGIFAESFRRLKGVIGKLLSGWYRTECLGAKDSVMGVSNAAAMEIKEVLEFLTGKPLEKHHDAESGK